MKQFSAKEYLYSLECQLKNEKKEREKEADSHEKAEY
jgi:hypothetical protein